jgi:hypothetical protein
MEIDDLFSGPSVLPYPSRNNRPGLEEEGFAQGRPISVFI